MKQYIYAFAILFLWGEAKELLLNGVYCLLCSGLINYSKLKHLVLVCQITASLQAK